MHEDVWVGGGATQQKEGRLHEAVDGEQVCRNDRLLQVPLASHGCHINTPKWRLGLNNEHSMQISPRQVHQCGVRHQGAAR